MKIFQLTRRALEIEINQGGVLEAAGLEALISTCADDAFPIPTGII